MKRNKTRYASSCSFHLLTPGACAVSNNLKVLSSGSEPMPLINVWGSGEEPNATSSLPQSVQCLPENPQRGPLLLTGGLLGTRLTCSTVGICVPGFLVKYQGALRSNHPHECRNFAARREILDIFSTAPSLLFWHLSHCFKEYCNQSDYVLSFMYSTDCYQQFYPHCQSNRVQNECTNNKIIMVCLTTYSIF